MIDTTENTIEFPRFWGNNLTEEERKETVKIKKYWGKRKKENKK